MLISIVDAFTAVPFQGNPAATVRLSAFPDDMRMQVIAREMNLSETAFAVPVGPQRFRLRWFTPSREVPLCGHATLAMAHTLREMGEVTTDQSLVFETLSGDLEVRFEGDDIILNFPAADPLPDAWSELIAKIVQQPHVYLGSTPMSSTVVLENQSQVSNFQPDLTLIQKLPAAGLCITAPADAARAYDFVNRFFAPQSGIPEDPVTGSAFCILAPYWSRRLGRPTLRARQLSARGGELSITHVGKRVLLRGQAVTTLRGNIVV